MTRINVSYRPNASTDGQFSETDEHAGIAFGEIDGSAEEVRALPEGAEDDISSQSARRCAVRSEPDHTDD